MKIDCLNTLLRKHPDAVITKVDHPNDSIFFHEKGREWVMIFEKTEPVGVWEMTSMDWAEQAQDQQETRRI